MITSDELREQRRKEEVEEAIDSYGNLEGQGRLIIILAEKLAHIVKESALKRAEFIGDGFRVVVQIKKQ